MKRITTTLLICTLLIGICSALPAQAQTPYSAADTLYELGLFQGTGLDASGRPVYALERTPSRGEAIVMLVRFLGVEREAIEDSYEGIRRHPFTDVPDWAAPHVGYAYAHGLTNGISPTEFGTNDIALSTMYLTFVLRALGYRDGGDNPDFSYRESAAFAKTIGLTDSDYSDGFLRGDLVIVSHTALDLIMKDAGITLIQHLVNNGAVAAQAAINAGFNVTVTADSLPEPLPAMILFPESDQWYDSYRGQPLTIPAEIIELVGVGSGVGVLFCEYFQQFSAESRVSVHIMITDTPSWNALYANQDQSHTDEGFLRIFAGAKDTSWASIEYYDLSIPYAELNSERLHIAIPKGNPNVVDFVNAVLLQMKDHVEEIRESFELYLSY